MATVDVQVELEEVHIDMPAADASQSTADKPTEVEEEVGDEEESSEDAESTEETSSSDEEEEDEKGEEVVLENLNKAIKHQDMEAFEQHLAELEGLPQGDSTVGERLAICGALCHAASVGSVPMMDTLIQKGVDINTKSVITTRSVIRSLDILSGGSIMTVLLHVVMEKTPLHMAVESGNDATVKSFVDKGADINIKDNDGKTPLHIAVESGNDATVKFFVDKGADINTKDNKGKTPLHKAVESGSDATVKVFIDEGAYVDIKDDDGNTPLHLAGKNGCHNAVRCLVDSGADVNTRNHIGTTPLHMATKNHHKGIKKYLVDHGADINMKDGKDVLEDLNKAIVEADVDSFSTRLAEVEELFQDNDNTARGLAASGALCHAAYVGSVPMMDTLIQKGVGVNTRSPDIEIDYYWMERWVPLHVAAWRGNINAVMHLVEKGADVNITNDFGRTPLHMAAALGYVDTLRILVDKGADINVKDSKRNTALQYASDLGHAEVVRCLVEKHADMTDPGNMYHNCLCLAIRSRHKEVAVILLGHENWEDMLKTSIKIDDRKTTPMRELIAVMPDVAEVAFNRCVTTNEGKSFLQEEVHATNDVFEVQYNYEFLEDFKDKHSSDSAESWHPVKFTKKDHPLYLMMKEGCSNLLKHPLTISLLEHKWTRFGRYIFFGNLFSYLIFLAFLTAFGLVVLSPLERTCVDVFNGSLNGTAPENCEGLSIHEYRFLYVGATVTILTALLRLAIEIFQLYRHPLDYVLDWVNWLEIPLYLFSIVFTFVFATPCLCVYSWQWQIGVVSVFLGWIGLITFLQKWPVTGVYVLMFVNILGSFMKIAFLAVLLVIAFAFAFYMLLFDPDEMRTPFSHSGRAIVKVMAMTTGELDFDDLYHQQEGEDEIAFPPLSFLLWIIFLVLMPVLLSNLLVGLAVGDVDRLQKSASENRIKLQIDLVLSLEELLESLGIRHWFAIKPKACFPNVPVTLLPRWCKRGIRDSDLAHNYHLYDKGRLAKVQKWIAEWYSKLWITDEYSTSGVKISDAIKPPPETIEKQLQKQHQHLDAQLQERCGHQSQQFERKLKEQMGQLETNLKEQLEIQLKEQREQIETKWKEQLAVLLKEQNDHQSEQLEAKLKEHSEKHSEQFQEAVRQLSECHKEQAKRSEELEFQTEKLAGEVVSLREALEKLVAEIAAK